MTSVILDIKEKDEMWFQSGEFDVMGQAVEILWRALVCPSIAK